MSLAENWHAARAIAHACGAETGPRAEPVALAQAHGRLLADPVVARVGLPGFDSVAMDGYAVAGPGPWRIVGRTLAGRVAASPVLAPGEAFEVATGAPAPSGADAVVPYEQAEVDPGALAAVSLSRGRHIRRAGEEVAAGSTVLAAGRVLTPAAVALAAAVGHDVLVVRARPQLSAVITGDEVLSAGVPALGHVRDAIGPLLPGALDEAGAQLASLEQVADGASGLLDAISGAAGDIVVVSGSSSAGLADHLDKCLHELGAQPLVRSVACTPGRTQSMWRLPDGRLVVGLPGNPFAALVAYLTLVEPACAGMLGRPLADLIDPPHLLPGACADLAAHPSRTRLVPVTVSGGEVVPTGFDGSAMVRGLAEADALAVIDPGSQPAVSQPTVGLLRLPGARLWA